MSKRLDILSWTYWQISKDELSYPFSEREWQYQDNEDRLIRGKRQWRGKDAWWRHALRSIKSPLLPWTRERSTYPDLHTLDDVFFPSRWRIYLTFAFYGVLNAFNDHHEVPDAKVGGAWVLWGEQGDYIAEWDPARTDRESAAKRRILEGHRSVADLFRKNLFFCINDLENWPCTAVKAIADIYSHREGYGEWL